MAKNTGDPRGPGMPGSGGWMHTQDDGPQAVNIKSSMGDLTWNFEDVWPFGGVYVRADDVLQVQIIAAAIPQLVLQTRILRPDGTVLVSQDLVAGVINRVPFFLSRQLAEGILLSVALVPNTAVLSSQYGYGSIGLRRQNLGATSLYQVLCAGYFMQACPLSWPGNTVQRPTDGAGIIRSITGTVPAAGADISEVVPANTRWQLLSLFAQLTTAVAVASRQANLQLDDGVNIFYETPNGPIQAASLVWEYNFAPCGFAPAVVLTDVAMHYDNSQILTSGFRIRTDTIAIQAADQWTAPQYLVREWQDNV
jgi:hypothetical protein